jgi:hypothetical protein
MNASKRTVLVAVIAALVAIGGGAVVADASNHAAFASSATQDGPGFGHVPGGPGSTPPAGGQPMRGAPPIGAG